MNLQQFCKRAIRIFNFDQREVAGEWFFRNKRILDDSKSSSSRVDVVRISRICQKSKSPGSSLLYLGEAGSFRFRVPFYCTFNELGNLSGGKFHLT